MSVFHFSWQCHSFFSFWKDGSEPTLGALIEKEEIERGSVSYSVYMYYAGNVGWCMLLLVLIMAVLDTSLSIGTSFWLSAWSEAGLGNEVGGRFFSVDICFKTIVGNNKADEDYYSMIANYGGLQYVNPEVVSSGPASVDFSLSTQPIFIKLTQSDSLAVYFLPLIILWQHWKLFIFQRITQLHRFCSVFKTKHVVFRKAHCLVNVNFCLKNLNLIIYR